MQRKTKLKSRTGVRVYLNEMHHDYPTAAGWGIDANGILAISVPTGRFAENGTELGETIAVFKAWDRVGWKTP